MDFLVVPTCCKKLDTLKRIRTSALGFHLHQKKKKKKKMMMMKRRRRRRRRRWKRREQSTMKSKIYLTVFHCFLLLFDEI